MLVVAAVHACHCAGLEWIFITSKLRLMGGVCGRLFGDVAIPEGTFYHGVRCIERLVYLNHGKERNVGALALIDTCQ